METLDTMILANPIDNVMYIYRDPVEQWAALKTAFAFMEEMVQEKKIKSYGFSSSLAYILDPYIGAFKVKQPIEKFDLVQMQPMLEVA